VSRRPTVDRRGGSIVLTLHPNEVQVLQWVFSDLGRMLSDGSNVDAVSKRLFPRAYLDPTEEASEAQWQEMVHDDLVDMRMTAMTDVVRSLDNATPISGRVEVTPEWDFDDFDPADPSYELHALYAWMTELLSALVTVLGG
jgi:hypothetical protein